MGMVKDIPQASHLVHRDLPVVLGRLRLHQVPALVPVAEEQFVLRDIVRKARYAIRPELQTDAVCIAASPQLLDLIAVESAADDEMVMDAVCLLSVFRAADILELNEYLDNESGNSCAWLSLEY